MASSVYPWRTTGLSFGAVGLLFGLPFASIIVFVMLLPSDGLFGNILASVGLALVPAVLSAVCAVLFVRLSSSHIPGLTQGVISCLLAYILFFVFLGIMGSDLGGVLATGLHLLTTAPLLWLFPLIGGVTGLILRRRVVKAEQ